MVLWEGANAKGLVDRNRWMIEMIITAKLFDEKLYFLSFHGLNFFIKLPMAKPTFEVFPSCDNAYRTVGLNGITICLIIFMHIDSLIYWHAKTTTRQSLAPLHSKCIQHVLNCGKDILELVVTLWGELCGVWWLRMVYRVVNACNWEFTVIHLSQLTRDHVLSHFQADLESQIMYDMTAIAYHVILNIKAVGLIRCVYLIRIRLASVLMPQYVHGSNNVLPPSLSDSNWLEGLGPVLLQRSDAVARIPANGSAAFNESCAPTG